MFSQATDRTRPFFETLFLAGVITANANTPGHALPVMLAVVAAAGAAVAAAVRLTLPRRMTAVLPLAVAACYALSQSPERMVFICVLATGAICAAMVADVRLGVIAGVLGLTPAAWFDGGGMWPRLGGAVALLCTAWMLTAQALSARGYPFWAFARVAAFPLVVFGVYAASYPSIGSMDPTVRVMGSVVIASMAWLGGEWLLAGSGRPLPSRGLRLTPRGWIACALAVAWGLLGVARWNESFAALSGLVLVLIVLAGILRAAGERHGCGAIIGFMARTPPSGGVRGQGLVPSKNRKNSRG